MREVQSDEVAAASPEGETMVDRSDGHGMPRTRRPDRLYVLVAEQLLDFVVREGLDPGAALPPERDLAARMGVSRNVLRQAFRVLEERGLVVTRRGSGRYVREVPAAGAADGTRVEDFEAASIADILESRMVLEDAAVVRACERRTLEEASDLAELARQLVSWDNNRNFHIAVAAATHNFMLTRLVAEQVDLLADLRQREKYDSASLHEHLEQHQEIAAAIMARDAERARSVVRSHLEFTRRVVLDAASAAEAPAPRSSS